MNLLIKNANLNGTIQDLLIEKTTIVKIGSRLSARDHTVIEADGGIVIPGFIDAHMHLDKCLLSERAPYIDVSGPEKGQRTREEKAKLSKGEIIRNSRRVIEACLRYGSLVLRTNVDVDPIIGLKGIEALLELKQAYRDTLLLQVVAFAQEGFENYPETAKLLREALAMGCDAVGGHTIVDKNGSTHIDKIFDIAREFNVSCEFHTDESGKPEHFLLPYLAEKTIREGFEGRVNAIHACSLAAVDAKTASETIQRVKDAGIRIIVAPTALATRQLTLVKELLAAGVPVCLGSDNIGDFFNPLGSGNMLHVAHLLTYAKRFFTHEEISQVFQMLTSTGASITGIEEMYALQEGSCGHVTIFERQSMKDVLTTMMLPTSVIRNGNIVCNHGLYDG